MSIRRPAAEAADVIRLAAARCQSSLRLGVVSYDRSTAASRPSESPVVTRQTDNASKYSSIDDRITRIIRLCDVSSLQLSAELLSPGRATLL